MKSTFTWLDYSERDRRKMMDVIASFKEPNTRDELGIGTIRDCIANMLFPGTGTVQSRARYFLFIPWIYRALEDKGIPSRDIQEKARQWEIELIYALEAGGEKGNGIIGEQARQDLQRLPSNIYWQGLGVWGVRRFAGSQDQYHRSLDAWYRAADTQTPADKGELFSDGTWTANWHPELPSPPSGWRDKVTFALRREEAQFLRDGIMGNATGSLLANLVDRKEPLTPCEFAWASDIAPTLQQRHREQLTHARNFSEVMHGAAILYNLLLANKAQNKERGNQYRSDLSDWADLIRSRSRALSAWDRAAFWTMLEDNGLRLPITSRTRQFVDQWINIAMSSSDLGNLASNREARDLISQREIDLKSGLARLTNPRALELWNEAAGLGRLDFRWGIAHRMANDILEGLKHA